jgi:hypothetical protein
LSSGGTPLALAQRAYDLVQVQPRRAIALAERARAEAAAASDHVAEVAALHALAWAQFGLGDPRAAGSARAGIRIAERTGNVLGAALLRRRLAQVHAFAGRTRAARRELDAAVAHLHGTERARSEVFRLMIDRRAHQADPAADHRTLAQAAKALRLLRRSGDEIWEARLLFARGGFRWDRGNLAAAEADLRRAHALYARLGADAAASDAHVALAQIAREQGSLLTCLGILDEVDAALRPGEVNAVLLAVRAAALAQARLLPEARQALSSYIEICARANLDHELNVAMLDQAAIAALALDYDDACRCAAQVARSFAARRKPVAAAEARLAWLRAVTSSGTPRRASVRAGLRSAAVLERAGQRREAGRAHLVVARAALAAGSETTARRQVGLARTLERRGTIADRIELAHVRALLCLAGGDRIRAVRLLDRGLALLEDYRAALGAVELRAAASGIGVELAACGLRVAIDSGDPWQILDWAERLRSSALRLPAVRPPADAALGALQTELRRVAAEIARSAARGEPARGLVARQTALESHIRARTRRAGGSGPVTTSRARLRDVARALDGRALVEYLLLDGALRALTLVDGQLLVHDLQGTRPEDELEWLRFSLGGLARGSRDPALLRAAGDTTLTAAVTLERLLLEPLLPTIGDAPLLIVPTSSLHAMPWAVLPSLRGRPLTVSPSLSTWLELVLRRPTARRAPATVVAGPRLQHAAQEARAVASLLDGPTVLTGRSATARATLSALDGAPLAHLACHGHFRGDSPLFSSLELADGPLNVYELQSLRRAPELIVLSACDLALSDLHPGDELLGFAAALLGMGTRTIVASVVPVPDAEARRTMVAFHRRLISGESPAAALAHAQARSAVPGFVCIGTG